MKPRAGDSRKSGFWDAVRHSAVYSLAEYSGDLIAGGSFSMVDGVSADALARWDGSQWSAMGTGPTNASFVFALAVHNHELIAGGAIYLVDGQPANSIARWNGTSWSTINGGTNGWVHALLSQGSNLFVGGSFSTAGKYVSSFFAHAQSNLEIGDATCDGVVDLQDLLTVIQGWGSCAPPPQRCNPDIAPYPDGDGFVNVADLWFL